MTYLCGQKILASQLLLRPLEVGLEVIFYVLLLNLSTFRIQYNLSVAFFFFPGAKRYALGSRTATKYLTSGRTLTRAVKKRLTKVALL